MHKDFWNNFPDLLTSLDGNAIIENNKDWLLDLNFIKSLREVECISAWGNKMLTCDKLTKQNGKKGLHS